MPAMKQWIRHFNEVNAHTTGLVAATSLYHNNSSVQSTGSKFNVTIVATHLFGITDTENIYSMELIVQHEQLAAPTASIPGETDDSVKGLYAFAKGPVLYSPRRLILVPPDHDLYLRVQKQSGNDSTNLHYGAQLLMQQSN